VNNTGLPPISLEEFLEGFPDGWIDASRPLRSATRVWPGDHPFKLDQTREGSFVLSSFSTTCHIGTHVDAPLHLDQTAHGVEALPLERCVGLSEVVRIPATGTAITPQDLPDSWLPSTSRILFRSDSYPIDAAIEEGFSGLSAELVRWLCERQVALIGVDTPSVDVFSSTELPAHRALLEFGMTWIEGLWLGNAKPGRYLMVALPMLLEGAEAAPVRAILKPLSI
jgi:arylformamidase